jgi:hypothetical protein
MLPNMNITTFPKQVRLVVLLKAGVDVRVVLVILSPCTAKIS